MQKFEYRTPRYHVDLPVILALDSAHLSGRCKEISKDGMMIHMRESAPPDACGTVTVSYREKSLQLPVSVVHNGKGQLGLKFLFESDNDRSALEHLVSLVAAAMGQPGPRLVR